MCSLVKRTLMRGRSLVPQTFLRRRQWRSFARRCFFSVLMSMRHGFCRGLKNHPLLNRLAFLALDVLARITHTLAFVRLRWIEAANFSGDLAHDLFVRTFDGQLGILLDCYFDLVGDGVADRMRIAEV